MINHLRKYFKLNIGDEFHITNSEFTQEDIVFKFTDSDLLFKQKQTGNWFPISNAFLGHLFRYYKNITISFITFNPAVGDLYYSISKGTRGWFVASFVWDNTTQDFMAKKLNLIYHTKEDAMDNFDKDVAFIVSQEES